MLRIEIMKEIKEKKDKNRVKALNKRKNNNDQHGNISNDLADLLTVFIILVTLYCSCTFRWQAIAVK